MNKQEDEDGEIGVGCIGNYYGGLYIKKEYGVYYWGIENYDRTEYEEIPKSLYDELNKLARKP